MRYTYVLYIFNRFQSPLQASLVLVLLYFYNLVKYVPPFIFAKHVLEQAEKSFSGISLFLLNYTAVFNQKCANCLFGSRVNILILRFYAVLCYLFINFCLPCFACTEKYS